jgi:hypothetical protein
MMITKLNATYLCIQRCQKLGKRRFVFIETLDHCVEHGFRLELVYIITMAGIFCEERKNDGCVRPFPSLNGWMALSSERK